ncbi:MAG: hypothetical protein IK093_09185 [Ruminiclostridium sp.]|nr:hypothetical protein [Ruminiclostridium sp.]
MKTDAFKGVIAGSLCTALLAASGCGGAPEVNAETLGAATSAPVSGTEPVSSQTTIGTFMTTTTTAAAPESVFSFRKGVWLAKDEETVGDGAYWFVTENGDIYYSLRENGSRGKMICELNGNDGVFYSGEKAGEGTASRFSVSDCGDTVRLTYEDSGHVTVLEYVSDDPDGWFRFYSDDELIEMAKAYYSAKHDGHVPTKAEASTENDGRALIQLYDDDSYSLNATSAWYFIDRFTGRGEDIDGRPIDLTDVANDGSALKTGVWWLKDKEYGGEIWVIQDNKAGYGTELINGIGFDFTYELDGNSGVFHYHCPTREGDESFTLGDNGSEIVFTEPDNTRKLVLVKEKLDGYGVYDNTSLVELANEYYAGQHNGQYPVNSEWSIEDDDRVQIQLYDKNGAVIERYFIDRFTAKGTDADGNEVVLAKTEETAENTAADQNNTYGG